MRTMSLVKCISDDILGYGDSKMAEIPFSQVLEILEAAGYSIHHRNKYPGTSEAYYYYLVHHDRQHPSIGFPVRAKMVRARYYETILDTLKGPNNEGDKE